ncbi:sugar phosphate isomerase/epimerase family protein [Cryptosporangium sp. NPDC048952]|uniref:sugar phosphate isomerase/epimerase family protein n=1 Tax=Cryptosporangium sp. NPDC048952 TaxID=3363961 RepID=UPI0037233181
MTAVELIATCWTSSGDVAPLAPDERSPFDIADRVAAVATTGWAGIGIAQDDVRHVRDTIGYAKLGELIHEAGLRYTELELLTDWWETGERRRRSDEVRAVLFDAAESLGATHIKIGTAFGEALTSIDLLISPLRDLADEAAGRGLRVALEPMPFSMVASVPMGADLVRAVDRPSCGLLVDSWHVFRAGTSLADLRASLTPDIVFAAELNDAAAARVGTLFEDTINERLLCGEGSFDLTGLIRTLTELGYRGPWGVEIISRSHRALPLESALQRAHDTAASVIRSAL